NLDVVTAAAQQFGCQVKRYEGGKYGAWSQLLISGNGSRWEPKGVNKWLRELQIFDQRSYQKRIPDDAFRLSTEQIALLLQHLWASDGCIWTRTRGRGSHRIYYATNSPQLAQNVATLLLRLGIVSRI